MAARQRLIAAAVVALCASSAQAFYGTLQPPNGWVPATVAGERAAYAKAASEHWIANAARTSAMLNVGGQSVRVPVTLRLASTAGAVFTSRLGVALLAGTGIGGIGIAALMALPAVVSWVQQQNQYKWSPTLQEFVRLQQASECQPTSTPTKDECGVPESWKAFVAYSITTSGNLCVHQYAGDKVLTFYPWTSHFETQCFAFPKTVTPPVEVPAPWPEPEPALQPLPITPDLPEAVPMPWPVEEPVVNPGPDGLPRPLRVPTGDPVPTPDPLKWKQPWVEITPSPTTDNPWRVDVKPGETLKDNPTPTPEPYTPDPAPDPNSTEKPPEEADLCEKHPDIIACQKIDLGTLDPVEPVDDKKTIVLAPDAGWGRAGACPAPRMVNLHGGLTLSIPLDLMCDFATMIRPLILAAAYLGAALMLVGAVRKD